ncbi:unnamed protein product [Lactuca saligna]|uniref:Uncharacterized protein n=1 Tax=Lactuca saligna TaxID=75948 RepID=A0AA35ZR63_LACSI|nr:unnamed protein product [Lactuca saligna]
MNSPPMMNNHISFSTTSSSSSFADDIVPHGSTPHVGDITEPMIQDELSPKPSPSPQVDNVPQVETVPPTKYPLLLLLFIRLIRKHPDPTFKNVVLSQLSLIVQITQSIDRRLTKVERDMATMKRCMVFGDDDEDMVVDDTPPSTPDVDVTTDQRIPDTSEHSEDDDYEGFLNLGFMQKVVVPAVPLNFVYHGSYFKGEISLEVPQGTDIDIEYDNDQLNPRKTLVSTNENANIQSADNQVKKIFNNNAEKQHIVSDLNDQIDRKKFGDVLTHGSKPNPIIKVRFTKLRNESLKLHLVRKKTKYEYTEVVYARELVKFGYGEWTKIQGINDKHKGVHAQEVKLVIQQLLNKVKKLNLVPSVGPSSAGQSIPSSSGRTRAPRKYKNTMCLLPYKTQYINNELPMGVELVQYTFSPEPEHGIFSLDRLNHMCYRRTGDLPSAPTEHLFHLRLQVLGHYVLEKGYCMLISLKLSKRRDEVKLDQFRWVKLEILKEDEKFYNGSSDDSEEEV